MDRRNFLRGSALTLAAGGLAGGVGDLLLPAVDAEAAADSPLPYNGSDKLLVKPHTLDYKSGFQSFAWSPAAKLFLYAQPAPHSGSGIARAMHYGDLRVSTITTGGHTSSGYMQLNGFGHGGVMGVEISPHKYSYLWIETYAHPNLDAKGNPTDADSRGICCIRYTGKGTYATTDLGTSKMPHSEHYKLKAGSTGNQVTYDSSTHRIALRYHLSSGTYYAIYDVNAVRAHGAAAKPLYDNIPVGHVEAGAKGSYQSFALWGNWLYSLHGTKSVNDATVHAYHLPTGSHAVAPLHAAAGSYGREPEGMAIYTGGSTPRLAYGIKNDQRSSCYQTSAIYYKA